MISSLPRAMRSQTLESRLAMSKIHSKAGSEQFGTPAWHITCTCQKFDQPENWSHGDDADSGLMTNRMKITILTYVEREGSQSYDAVVNQVAEGLEKRGHQASILAI